MGKVHGHLGLQGSCEETSQEMGQRHSWDGDCPPLRQLGRGGRSARGALPRGLVFRVGAGAWAGRRLAGRTGARLRQLGQKGLIVGAREGCGASKQ